MVRHAVPSEPGAQSGRWFDPGRYNRFRLNCCRSCWVEAILIAVIPL